MDGTGHHEMFWEVVTSMWIGNAMLLVINLLLIGLWVRLLQVPYRLRFPAIVLLCCIGMYSVNNQPGDIVQVGVFGLIGYLCCKLRLEPSPLLLGFILGPLMEENPHRGRLVVSHGNVIAFLSDPLTVALLFAAALVVLSAIVPKMPPAAAGAGPRPVTSDISMSRVRFLAA